MKKSIAYYLILLFCALVVFFVLVQCGVGHGTQPPCHPYPQPPHYQDPCYPYHYNPYPYYPYYPPTPPKGYHLEPNCPTPGWDSEPEGPCCPDSDCTEHSVLVDGNTT